MSDRTDLVERIESALANADDCPWLPDLTADVVKMGWRDLHEKAGLSPDEYGTSRVITRSGLSHRNVVGHLSTSSAVEVLDDILDSYYGEGIEFYTTKEITGANLLGCVEDAIKVIKRVPTLHATVAVLVRSLHLIKQADDDYDVSFSEPHIPFSIFVSVPRQRKPVNSLRVAEAIVHEAMHLQLTLVEQVVPLVKANDRRYFSPWRHQYRPVQGLLHAFYVFKVIDRFIENLYRDPLLFSDCSPYLKRRRFEIKKQMREIDSFQESPDLTAFGKRLVRVLSISPLESNRLIV
ncbi:MAG TPA: HEXXH motif-containing putative peptide modification protein [Blastocatellia bacterium]|nr:HEXXH motif-containing putative peptide modification protein [Blastocatellia bacterium]